MDVDRGKEILKKACMNYTEFSKLMGVKPITVRLAFSQKRLSKKMVAKLLEMEEPQKEEEEKSERTLIKEGMINQSMGDVRSAKVYLLPKNPYLRFIEFSDGTHGKFRQSRVVLDWEVWSRLRGKMEICTPWKGIMTGRID